MIVFSTNIFLQFLASSSCAPAITCDTNYCSCKLVVLILLLIESLSINSHILNVHIPIGRLVSKEVLIHEDLLLLNLPFYFTALLLKFAYEQLYNLR